MGIYKTTFNIGDMVFLVVLDGNEKYIIKEEPLTVMGLCVWDRPTAPSLDPRFPADGGLTVLYYLKEYGSFGMPQKWLYGSVEEGQLAIDQGVYDG